MVVPWRISNGASAPCSTGAKGSRPTRRNTSVKLGPGPSVGSNIGRLIEPGTLTALRDLLATLLYVTPDEFLIFLLEYLVDLVQHVVELSLQLFALLIGAGDLLYVGLVVPRCC